MMSPTDDVELGNMMIQERVQHLLYYVNEHKNSFQGQQEDSPSICMAPRKLRDLNPSSFNPSFVYLGLLHREDEKMQQSEWLKANFLIKLMNRINFPQEEILKSCMQKVYTSMNQIRAIYHDWEMTYSIDKIAEMMVIDACFILEFIYKYSNLPRNVISLILIRDLVLLENQIPFFILDEIFQCTILKFDPEASLVQLIVECLKYLPFLDGAYDLRINDVSMNSSTSHHILSILHQCYKPSYIRPVSIPLTIPSAGDLDSAGVKFKRNRGGRTTWPIEMKVETHWCSPIFGSWCKPTLRMPPLIISHDTEAVLRNLLAYEQLIPTSGNYITSYVVAMGMLVKTEEDVAKLVDSKVIKNYFGSNEEAAHIINNMCKELTLTDFFYNQQWETLNKYWRNNIAWFRRTYFKSPWNMTALLAGIFLFLLTVVQTIFTIKQSK